METFFDFLVRMHGKPTGGEPKIPGVEVREFQIELSDEDFHKLGRALTYRRTAAELRTQAARTLDCASRMEANAHAELQDLQESLASKIDAAMRA
jgi:hypothetical protein